MAPFSSEVRDRVNHLEKNEGDGNKTETWDMWQISETTATRNLIRSSQKTAMRFGLT